MIPQFLKACPKCNSGNVYERKTMIPRFRCTNCGYTTHRLKNRVNTNTTKLQNKKFFSLFFKQHKKEIDQSFILKKEKAEKEYYDFKDITVLCRRCHFAVEKGMILCKKCKEKYHKSRYIICRECFNKI